MIRQVTYKPDGNIAREVPVCADCNVLIGRGVRPEKAVTIRHVANAQPIYAAAAQAAPPQRRQPAPTRPVTRPAPAKRAYAVPRSEVVPAGTPALVRVSAQGQARQGLRKL
jgi:hypothetical protein